jgi:hypothetical protein
MGMEQKPEDTGSDDDPQLSGEGDQQTKWRASCVSNLDEICQKLSR